jgi:hypothetical protein
MVFLVRKIDGAKWRQNDIENGSEASADAITGSSLRTLSNALSVWMIHDETEASINEAFLAIGSFSDHMDTFEIALLPETQLTHAGLSIVETDGETLIGDLVKTHRDIVDLNYSKIGSLKNIIIDSFREGRVKKIRRQQLKTLLEGAIRSGRIQKDALKDDVKKNITTV